MGNPIAARPFPTVFDIEIARGEFRFQLNFDDKREVATLLDELPRQFLRSKARMPVKKAVSGYARSTVRKFSTRLLWPLYTSGFLKGGIDHVLQLPDGQLIAVNFQDLKIGNLEVAAGSIRSKFVVTASVIAGLYTGIATYPTFKEGAKELHSDIEWILTQARKGVSEMLGEEQVPSEEQDGSEYLLVFDERSFRRRLCIANTKALRGRRTKTKVV